MRKPSRRLGLALAASLLVHLALFAFLKVHQPAPQPSDRAQPIQLQIVQLKRRGPRSGVRGPSQVHKSRARARARARRTSPPASTKPAASKPAPALAKRASSPGKPSAPKLPRTKAREVPDLAAAGTAEAGKVAGEALALGPAPKPPARRGVQAPYVIPDQDERVSAMIRSRLGRDRVERGLIDPYFDRLGDALSRQWKPDPYVDEKGLSGFFKELRRSSSEYTKAWLAAAARYGKTGSPYGPGGPETTGIPGELDFSRVAVVRLTQRPDGHLLRVELVQPSIDPEMDAELLKVLRGGRLVIPVPPLHGQGIHDPIRSLWAFELQVSIAPPAPMLSGNLDPETLFDRGFRREVGGFGDLRLPLSRRIVKQVKLLSVE